MVNGTRAVNTTQTKMFQQRAEGKKLYVIIYRLHLLIEKNGLYEKSGTK
jgi:hypothetical protein